MRKCNRCEKEQVIENFRFRAEKGLYLRQCRDCEKAIQKIGYKKAKEHDPIMWRISVLRANRSRDITRKWLDSKLEQQGYKCALSGRPIDILSLEVDHIIPRSKGGSNEASNLQLVCREANSAKSALSKEELIQLCTDILKTLKPEIIGHAILAAEKDGRA